MQVNISIDKNANIKEIMRSVDRSLTLYRDEIIEDENTLVPVQGAGSHNGGGGSLQGSAFLHSDSAAKDGKITIRWATPYAHYQHKGLVMHGPVGNRTYGPDHLKYTSSTAKAEWTKHAPKIYGANWAKGIQKLLGG